MTEILKYEKRPLPVPKFPFGLANKMEPAWDSTMSINPTGGYYGSTNGDNTNGSGNSSGGGITPWMPGYWKSVTDCDNNTFSVWTQGTAP